VSGRKQGNKGKVGPRATGSLKSGGPEKKTVGKKSGLRKEPKRGGGGQEPPESNKKR